QAMKAPMLGMIMPARNPPNFWTRARKPVPSRFLLTLASGSTSVGAIALTLSELRCSGLDPLHHRSDTDILTFVSVRVNPSGGLIRTRTNIGALAVDPTRR